MSQEIQDDAAPPCERFEDTLALVDGLAGSADAVRARAHAASCAVCGPMVAGWADVSRSLAARYEDAAELAKPDLAKVADAVLSRVASTTKAPQPRGRVTAFLSFLQAPVALIAAAAALAFVVLPMAQDPATSPLAEVHAPVTTAPASLDPNNLHMHKLSFEGADGMVFKTGVDNATVIWVSEHDGT